jgi:hypothetical protein
MISSVSKSVDRQASPLFELLSSEERDVAAFFQSLTPDEFVLRVGDAWTPAEHLQHLNIAVSAVARGLSISPWILRLRFGRARQPSRSLVEVRDDYRERLARGGRARGGFVPPREELSPEQITSRRADLLARWQRVNSRLTASLERWSDRNLDRIRLPHPILGKITAREMVFFTIYHGHHHIAAAKSRLPRFSRSSSS